ncbi:unnamed protein product [Dovyalis caffra]|uniref:Uncharacterized protein n=1 Tax=Dovyalis caffra TaxID=77055 RepID=A0AAV1SQV3_9ROSI|nr:unnamed protein product [Dovyalis caffra]
MVEMRNKWLVLQARETLMGAHRDSNITMDSIPVSNKTSNTIKSVSKTWTSRLVSRQDIQHRVKV